MTNKKYKILIVAGGSPRSISVATNINKLIKIFSELSQTVFLISFCDGDLINLTKDDVDTVRIFPNRYEQFVKSQFLQLEKMNTIFKKREINLVFFAYGQDLQLLPILFAKIMGKKIILRSDGRPSFIVENYLQDQSVMKKFFFKIIEYINYHTVDLLVSECGYLQIQNRQEIPGHSGIANLPIDTKLFKRCIPLSERQYDIGYFGRIQNKKGIINLVESVAIVVKNKKNLSMIIGGNGEQKEEIVRFIQKNNLEQNIHIIDWIPHEILPEYLNAVKIFILPSKLEGLPNTVLEAMTCGAIVLSTPVGGVPGLITDGETGFIMENNSVACITENIVRVMNNPDLERIADNAYSLMHQEFSLEVTLERYRTLIEKA